MPNEVKALTSSLGETDFSLKKIMPQVLTIIVSMIMVLLDGTVVNNAIPTIVEYFHTDLKTIQWTVTGYTLALSVVIPLAGWLTDKFGQKNVFMFTVGMFTIGSFLCGVAQTPEQLIIFRIIQGLGGGMVAPIGMAMVFQLAPPEKRGAVMGLLGMPMLLAPAFGPVLSGWLVDTASWHWIFMINLPIGVLALLLCIKFLPKGESKKPPRLDFWGMVLAPLAFVMLAYGVSEGSSGWSSTSAITGISIGLVALLMFIIVELRHKQPLLELKVFKSSDFTRGIILSWIVQIGLFGSMLLLPLYLQNAKGYTAIETGWILMPQAICAGIAMPISGRLFDKVGARPLAFAGLTLAAISMYVLSNIQLDTSLWIIVVAICMSGFGLGLSSMPLNTHILSSAPPRLVSRVTPLTSASQQVVVSFVAAGLTGFLTSRISSHVAGAANGVNPLESVISGYGDTFLLTSCIAVLGVALSLILRKPRMNNDVQLKDGENAPTPSRVH